LESDIAAPNGGQQSPVGFLCLDVGVCVHVYTYIV